MIPVLTEAEAIQALDDGHTLHAYHPIHPGETLVIERRVNGLYEAYDDSLDMNPPLGYYPWSELQDVAIWRTVLVLSPEDEADTEVRATLRRLWPEQFPERH